MDNFDIPTRLRDGVFELFIDGAWHSRAPWRETCPQCGAPLRYQGFMEGGTITFWGECDGCRYRSKSTEVGFPMETQNIDTAFRVRVGGAWRQRRDIEPYCPLCRNQCRLTPLEYYGAVNTDGTTRFWAVCPVCGYESPIYGVGVRRPTEQHSQGHGWLRIRRAASGY